jgi:hypothetical protein
MPEGIGIPLRKHQTLPATNRATVPVRSDWALVIETFGGGFADDGGIQL